MNRFYSS